MAFKVSIIFGVPIVSFLSTIHLNMANYLRQSELVDRLGIKKYLSDGIT